MSLSSMLEVTLMLVVVAVAINSGFCSPGDGPTIDDDCSIKDLDDCLVELDMSGKPLGKSIIPYLTDAELTDLCRHWEESQPCILRVLDKCAGVNTTTEKEKQDIKQRAREVNFGHEYLCESDMRAKYSTTIRECAETKEEDILKLEHTCQEEYHNMSWYYDTHNPENIHNFCKAAKTYISCLTEGVLEICGKTVSRWVRAYHMTLWKPHLENISCHPSEGVETGALVIITLCGSATVYSVVCVIAAFVQDTDKFKQCMGKCKMGSKHKQNDGKGDYAVQTTLLTQEATTKDL